MADSPASLRAQLDMETRERDRFSLEADRERDPAALAALIGRAYEKQLRLFELERRIHDLENQPSSPKSPSPI